MPKFRDLRCWLPALLVVLTLTGCASGPINGVPSESGPVVHEPARASASPAYEPARFEIRESIGGIATIDLTAASDDVWERIRKGFGMPDLNNDLVMSQQVWYLSRPEHLKRVFERSRRYLFHIVQEIEKRGMPTELALLPVVESAFNPMAQSPARASGLWQFIPSTGKSYGLEQNWWLDERRDIVASTSAALDYLQYVYDMHGDWHLALASYNWGENAVARAIARNEAAGLPRDYASLEMPAETRNYVPKLQALKNIVARPQLFGLAIDPIPNQPYFTTIKKAGDMDIAVAARLAEMPVEEFRALNPAHNRPVIKSAGEAALVLPADKVDTFLSNLENHDKPLVSWHSYTVPRKARLDKVAAHLGLSSTRLSEANGISPLARIPAGYQLLVPAGSRPGAAIDEPAGAVAVKYQVAHSGTMQAQGSKKAQKNVRVAKAAAHKGGNPSSSKVGQQGGGKKRTVVAKGRGKTSSAQNGSQHAEGIRRVNLRASVPVRTLSAKGRASY